MSHSSQSEPASSWRARARGAPRPERGAGSAVRRSALSADARSATLVLLATFSSLRWGEVTALRRADLDLTAGTVRVRATFIERSTGEILLGPPKSRAGRRVVGVPQAIIPVLSEHLAVFVKDEPGALVFPGAMDGPLRRGNFNRMSAWPYAVRSRRARSPRSANGTLMARKINKR
jgi:integrase